MDNDINNRLKPDSIIRAPIFPEPLKLITAIPLGDQIKLVGTGLETNQV